MTTHVLDQHRGMDLAREERRECFLTACTEELHRYQSAQGRRRVAIFRVRHTATEYENKTVVVAAQQCETSRVARA